MKAPKSQRCSWSLLPSPRWVSTLILVVKQRVGLPGLWKELGCHRTKLMAVAGYGTKLVLSVWGKKTGLWMRWGEEKGSDKPPGIGRVNSKEQGALFRMILGSMIRRSGMRFSRGVFRLSLRRCFLALDSVKAAGLSVVHSVDWSGTIGCFSFPVAKEAKNASGTANLSSLSGEIGWP